MKKLFQLTLTLLILVSCSDPTQEEALKKSLEDQLGKSISEVIIGDTVMVGTLKSELVEIDSTLNELETTNGELLKGRIEQEALLKEAQEELSSAGHPALAYGYADVVVRVEENIKNYTESIAKNIQVIEELKTSKQNLESKIKSSGEKIAYINVNIKIGQSEQQLIVNPDFKIIK